MSEPLPERIRREALRRLAVVEPTDTSDIHVVEEGDAFVLEGTVDDAFGKGVIESVARELARGKKAVRSRLLVRHDLATEAAAKETEFASGEAAPTRSIPNPER
jgi:hypothetical protein